MRVGMESPLTSAERSPIRPPTLGASTGQLLMSATKLLSLSRKPTIDRPLAWTKRAPSRARRRYPHGSPASGSSHWPGSTLPIRRSASRSMSSLKRSWALRRQVLQGAPATGPEVGTAGRDAIGCRLDHLDQLGFVKVALSATHAILDSLARQCASDKHGLAGAYNAPAVMIQVVNLPDQAGVGA